MAQLFLSNEAADITGYKALYINTRRAPSTALATSVTNTTSGGFSIQATASAGGTALAWISKPFAAAVTITSSALSNFWLAESAAAANASMSFALYKYTTSEQAAFLATTTGPAEPLFQVARARYVAVTTTGTATSFAVGDRLVVKCFVENVGTMGASETITMSFDGLTEGADGNTFIQIAEPITVSEQQIGPGTYPAAIGFGQGFYQSVIENLNALVGANCVSNMAAVKTLIDELGFQRDNL